ncbi:MAG: hypothetical protein AAGF98_04410 [Cyanobacteria bacterium P01_H01_bin.153]
MNHQPQDSRRQAAHKFVDALDELESMFKSEPSDETPQRQTERYSAGSPREASSRQAAQRRSETADFGSLLDDAVQDIEQFMSTEDHPHPEP